jgi:hypothetical protein
LSPRDSSSVRSVAFVFLHQSLTPAQDIGFAIALLALVAGQLAGARRKLARPAQPHVEPTRRTLAESTGSGETR